MSLRSARERAVQAVCYEVFGLLFAVPFYLLSTGSSLGGGLVVMALVGLAELLCCPLFNTSFDRAERRLCGRLASDRPQRWRIVHAICHEAAMTLVCVPILMRAGGLGLGQALALDLGLTVLYVGYAYLFHLAYDRVRPVAAVRGAAFAS